MRRSKEQEKEIRDYIERVKYWLDRYDEEDIQDELDVQFLSDLVPDKKNNEKG
jgi:hypothetical protein